MGDKIESKKLAIEARSTPSRLQRRHRRPGEAVEIARDRLSGDDQGLRRRRRQGLRVAYNDAEAFEGFSSCVNEARNSFGDDRVFIEKYVLEPRHIEIQVLGDSHGNWCT
jgi:propionyl-CoA carboxylase alpha chain